MYEIYCFRCSLCTNSPDGVCCPHCGNDQTVVTSYPENLQPAASESANVNPGYYVPAPDASTQPTDADLSFLADNNGGHKYIGEGKNNSSSQVLHHDSSQNKNTESKSFGPSKGESISSVDDSLAVPGPSGFHQNKNASNFYEENFLSRPSIELESVALTGEKTFSFSFSENMETEKAVPEQDVHNSGIVDSNVFKKHVKSSPKCRECGNWFKNESALNVHQQNNCDPNPYKCDRCDKRFRYEYLLLNHQLKYTGEKKYQCDICAKKFVRKFSLACHRRLHTEETPFQCDQCAFATKYKRSLKGHKERWH